MKEVEMYELAAQTAATKTTKHPDHAILAARIALDLLYRRTADSFSETVRCLYTAKGGAKVSMELYNFVSSNSEVLDAAINHERDDDYTYFGYETLARSYLLRVNDNIVERPQHMLMRVSAAIHAGDVAA